MRVDTPSLIPKINKPPLVLVAGHFFRDLYADDAVDAIDVFLKDVDY